MKKEFHYAFIVSYRVSEIDKRNETNRTFRNLIKNLLTIDPFNQIFFEKTIYFQFCSSLINKKNNLKFIIDQNEQNPNNLIGYEIKLDLSIVLS